MGAVPFTQCWSSTWPQDTAEYLISTFFGDKSFPLSSDFWHKLLELPLHLQWPSDHVRQAYEAFGPLWKDTFEYDNILFTSASPILEVDFRQENKIEFASHESFGPSGNEQEANKPSPNKVHRKLAQNRKATRKVVCEKRLMFNN